MNSIASAQIYAFLQLLGERYPHPAMLTLLGGSALCLLGSARPTLDIDYVGDDRHKTDLQHLLEQVAQELQIEIEAVPIEQFVPIPAGADERRLFVNDTERQHIRVFDRCDPNVTGNGHIWAETRGDGAGAPDGMKIDLVGNIYCCGPGGIHVFAPDALCLGVIGVPEYTANFCWGDADYRSLFITASTSLYRIRTRIPGRPLF